MVAVLIKALTLAPCGWWSLASEAKEIRLMLASLRVVYEKIIVTECCFL